MVADRIFRHIATDRQEFEMTAEKWNYLITMTTRIQNVISSTVVTKERRNLQKQVLAWLKLVHNTEGKVIHPVQARHALKVELPQFADNTQQHTHEFLMAILPVLQLPRDQESVSSVLQCKCCKYQSIKKEVFSCIEVPVPERGVANLENCLERWFKIGNVQAAVNLEVLQKNWC